MMNLQSAEQILRGNGWLRQLAHDWKARFPAATFAARRAMWKSRRGAEIRRYFAEHPVAKVQVGSGPYVQPGWLNTDLEPFKRDVIFLDATEPLPFPPQAIDYMYSEHMIEHISHADAAKFLAECFRVMKPGGRLRVATPNLRNILKIYMDPASDATRTYLNWSWYRDLPDGASRPAAVLNRFVRSWGHQFIYDPDSLRETLEAAGFVDVTFCEVGESEDPALRGLEQHGEHVGEWNNKFETMIAEAVRPRR